MSVQNTLSSAGMYLSTVSLSIPTLPPFPVSQHSHIQSEGLVPLTRQSSDLRASGLSLLFFCLVLSSSNHLIFHVILTSQSPSPHKTAKSQVTSSIPCADIQSPAVVLLDIILVLVLHPHPRFLSLYSVLTQIAMFSTCTAYCHHDCCLLVVRLTYSMRTPDWLNLAF